MDSGYVLHQRNLLQRCWFWPSELLTQLPGNTFPSTVFCLFGGFWFTFGATIVPSFNAYGLYSTTNSVADGLSEAQFYSTFSFFLIAMAILCFVFLIASIRTNI